MKNALEALVGTNNEYIHRVGEDGRHADGHGLADGCRVNCEVKSGGLEPAADNTYTAAARDV